jgi:nitroreductase
MLEAIAKRVSCRAYKPDPVPEEAVTELFQAALCAPSGNNSRPWHIIVVRDKAKREILATAHRWAAFCAQSPVVIAVCADTEKSPHWWIEDCSAAVENILLQATALGLGTCWIGIRGGETRDLTREDHVRAVCGIPGSIRVVALVSVGYPAGQGQPKGPAPLDVIHYDTW